MVEDILLELKNSRPTAFVFTHSLTVYYRYMTYPSLTPIRTDQTCHHYFCSQKMFKITQVIPQWSLIPYVITGNVLWYILEIFCNVKQHFSHFFKLHVYLWSAILILFSTEKVLFSEKTKTKQNKPYWRTS